MRLPIPVSPSFLLVVRNWRTLRPKLGRKRLFYALIYIERFASEHTFAWIDKFRALLIRFEINKIYFMGNHYLAFTLINLRYSLVP